MKRFWTGFFAVLSIAIILSLPWAKASSGVFFAAVNDQLLPISTSTTPIVRSGTAYVPYTAFSPDVAKASLGVFVTRNQAENTLTLYGRDKILIFDLSSGTSRDLETSYSTGAISQSGTVYLPAYFVSRHFDLEYSYLSTSSGTIIRLKNSDASLNDSAFVRGATSLMQQYIQEATQAPQTGTSTAPAVSSTPRPSASAAPSSAASPAPVTPSGQSPSPSASPTDPQETTDTTAYLAFLCTPSGETEGVLDALDAQGARATFFIRPQDIALCDDTVRRIVGSGHGIGLYLDTDEAPEASLAAGCKALAETAYVSTRLVWAPALDSQALEDLTEAGYRFFVPNVQLSDPGTIAATAYGRLTRDIESASTVRILLEDTALTVELCPRLLALLQDEPYSLKKMTETSR